LVFLQPRLAMFAATPSLRTLLIVLVFFGDANVQGAPNLYSSNFRFGDTTDTDSIDSYGDLEQPFYLSAATGGFAKLTYNTYSLSTKVEITCSATVYTLASAGSTNGCTTNTDCTDSLTLATSNLPVSGSTAGSITVTSPTRTGLTLKRTYTIASDSAKEASIAFEVENTSGGACSDLKIYVGTSDDWIGTTDTPDKQLGACTYGSCATTFSSSGTPTNSAIKISSSTDELFLSSDDAANTKGLIDAIGGAGSPTIFTKTVTAHTSVTGGDNAYALYLHDSSSLGNGNKVTKTFEYSALDRVYASPSPPSEHYSPGVWAFLNRKRSAAQQDPHLQLAHGGKTDFRGRDGGVYNFLSDKDLSVNLRIRAVDFILRGMPEAPAGPFGGTLVHGTFMKEAYATLRLSPQRVVHVLVTSDYASRAADADGSFKGRWLLGSFPPAPIGGHDGHRGNARIFDEAGKQLQLVGPQATIDLGAGCGIATGEHVTVISTPQWNVTFGISPIYGAVNRVDAAEPPSKIDIGLAIKAPEHTLAVAPHGLLGQSYDMDGLAVNGRKDDYRGAEFTTAAQGEGAIEGVYTEYEMVEPFGVDFKYSRWGKQKAAPRNISRLNVTHGPTKAAVSRSTHAAALSFDPSVALLQEEKHEGKTDGMAELAEAASKEFWDMVKNLRAVQSRA